ncbi:MAG TPA: tripartite tricarboxylate transporter substrate-binding protein, partial [Casimicrobiaceae bacterium]|nr:tripartite tricarboxylate transporter substrate-binding protein [Casimicrobiaceae bacterium]
MKRSSSIALTLCAAFVSIVAVPTSAQDKIDKPVKILVGFPPGGTADIMARAVADKMKDSLGQPVIVENRPGAIGRIAADAVKAAAPDGSTIMVMPIGPMAVVPHTYKTLSYDPMKDFAPIGMGST